VQHDPGGELLVDGLLGIARQADGVGGLDKVRGRALPIGYKMEHAGSAER
jgi:hypothetical protein